LQSFFERGDGVEGDVAGGYAGLLLGRLDVLLPASRVDGRELVPKEILLLGT